MRLPKNVLLQSCRTTTLGTEVCKYSFSNRPSILLSVSTEKEGIYIMAIYKNGKVLENHTLFPYKDAWFEGATQKDLNQMINLLASDKKIDL